MEEQQYVVCRPHVKITASQPRSWEGKAWERVRHLEYKAIYLAVFCATEIVKNSVFNSSLISVDSL